MSLDVAVLDERRRSLASLQSTLLSEQESAATDGEMARQRFAELEQEGARLQLELEEARKPAAAGAAITARKAS